MFEKTNEKNSKGITLIALIITIIVLLILAGVTINAITGSESTMEKAKEAADKTELGNMKDEVRLLIVNREFDSTKSFKEDLINQFGSSNVKDIGTGENALTHVFYITKNGRDYTVFQNGDVEDGKVEVWDGQTATEPTNKTSNEIHIYTCSEMKWLADEVNKDEAGTTFSGYTIYLENDLDFGARELDGEWENEANEKIKWTPIGIVKNNTTQKLEGTFEGQNHTIEGIYVNQTENFGGIFGNSSSINNLSIKDSYIRANNAVGGIVGAMRSGSMNNCHNINTQIIANGTVVGRSSWTSFCGR